MHLPWTQWDLARRVALAVAAAAPTPVPSSSHPSAQAQGPQKGTFGAVPRWPRLALSPLPWAGQGLFCSEPSGTGLGQPDSTVRGAGGAALPTPGCSAPLAVQPHVLSVPPPPGRHLARSMPPRASRCRVVSRPPLGLGRQALPSHLHSPGHSFADF